MGSTPNPATDNQLVGHDFGAPLDALHLGWWALQFTPRVALLGDAVVLEVQASERLFGGAGALRQRITEGASGLGVAQWAQAGTARAALALARVRPGSSVPDEPAALAKALSPLPLEAVDAVAQHAATLSRLGCRTLGQVLALPRASLGRRLGADLLDALDEAHGLRPQAFDWLTLPQVFDKQTELPHRVESALPLHHFYVQMLHPLCAWLAGHQAGCEVLELRWCHEWSRHGHDRWQRHVVRMAQATREPHSLATLLREHLLRIDLQAPVTDIGLRVDTLVRQGDETPDLFAGAALHEDTAGAAQRRALLALLDKLSVRLGPERVQQAQVLAEHRLERAQVWVPAVSLMSGSTARRLAPLSAAVPDTPLPNWLLPRPRALSLAPSRTGQRDTPLYQGPLQLLAGPQRIETGWWDSPAHATPACLVARDHHLASSPQAGLLWVYRLRHPPVDGSSPWYLQGFFA